MGNTQPLAPARPSTLIRKQVSIVCSHGAAVVGRVAMVDGRRIVTYNVALFATATSLLLIGCTKCGRYYVEG